MRSEGVSLGLPARSGTAGVGLVWTPCRTGPDTHRALRSGEPTGSLTHSPLFLLFFFFPPAPPPRSLVWCSRKPRSAAPGGDDALCISSDVSDFFFFFQMRPVDGILPGARGAVSQIQA